MKKGHLERVFFWLLFIQDPIMFTILSTKSLDKFNTWGFYMDQLSPKIHEEKQRPIPNKIGEKTLEKLPFLKLT